MLWGTLFFQGAVLVLGWRSHWYKAAESALWVGDGKNMNRSLRLREPSGVLQCN